MLKKIIDINKKWLIIGVIILLLPIVLSSLTNIVSMFKNEGDENVTFINNNEFIFHRNGTIYRYNLNLMRYSVLYKLQNEVTFNESLIEMRNMLKKNADEIFLNGNQVLNIKTKKTRKLNLYKYKTKKDWNEFYYRRDVWITGNYCFISVFVEGAIGRSIQAKGFSYDTGEEFIIPLIHLDKDEYDDSPGKRTDFRVLETDDPDIVIFNIVMEKTDSTCIILYRLSERKEIFHWKYSGITYQPVYDAERKRILVIPSDTDIISVIDTDNGKRMDIAADNSYDTWGKIYIKNNKIIMLRYGLKRDDPRWKTGFSSGIMSKPQFFEIRDLDNLKEKKEYKIPDSVGNYIGNFDVNDSCDKIIFTNGQTYLFDLKRNRMKTLTMPGLLWRYYYNYFGGY